MSILDWLRGRRADGETDTGPVLDADTGEVLQHRPEGARPRRSEPADGTVAGERTIPSVSRERSIHARVNNALAIGTLALLGGGFLTWYYVTQFAKVEAARSAAQKATEARIAGDSRVPPLGRVDPPHPNASAASAPRDDGLLAAPPLPPPGIQPVAAGMPQGQPAKTPEQLALERKLGQPVLLRGQPGGQAPAPAGAPPSHPPNITALLAASAGGPVPAAAAAAERSGLGEMLQPTPTPAVSAQVLPTRRFLLPKGAFVDCTLETAIDSTFDGMVTCIGANDVYSADGKVVLLERGTKYVGEKRGDTRLGQARVFVLWNEARTPTGVAVNLASPGTDELGRAGLPGHVDNHFWDRFGAAILISVIDGGLQALAASQRDGGGNAVVLNPQGSRDVMTEVLKGTIAIPPTVVKNQGERVQVLVARDVDFRSVYALRTVPDAR